MDWAALPWGDMGTGSLIALTIVSIIRGWLIPARQAERALRNVETDRDNWRATAEAKDATIRTLANQLEEALESARTAKEVLGALSKVANHG